MIGQVDADHLPDPAGPQPPRVDDVLGDDRPLLGLQPPLPRGELRHRQHAVVLHDVGPSLPGRHRVGVGGAVRVQVPLVGVEQRTGQPRRVDDRAQLGRLARGQQVCVGAHRPVPGQLGPQPLPPSSRAGQLQPARQVEPRPLAALGLDLRVHLDRVLLQPGDGGVGVDRMEPTRRVPARAGRELGPLDQGDVGQPAKRQVVQHAAADDAAADDDDLVPVPHAPAMPTWAVISRRRENWARRTSTPVQGPLTTSGSASWSCPASTASTSVAMSTPTNGAALNWWPLVPMAT